MVASTKRCLFFLLIFLCFPVHGLRADELAEKINTVVSAPEYKHARWGILIIDAETGKSLYERNPDMLFAPASVTKLYTCAAALVAFGPDYTFETPVYRRGEIVEGRLRGDLILVAKGDFTLGGRTDATGKMAFKDQDHIYAGPTALKTELTDTDPLSGLKSLAKQIKDSGIRQIDGDVLIDDRLFARSRGSGSGPDVITPIVVNDNLVDVIVTPGMKVGDAATVQMQPLTKYMQIDVQVETVADEAATRINVEHVGPERFVVRGKISLKARPQVRICPVDEPAGFARAVFIDVLQHEGVMVHAASGLQRVPTVELPEQAAYAKLTRVAAYKSPPLSEALKVTLKVSHNLYASMMPLLLAANHDKRTLPDGLQLEGEVLAKLGVDVKEIALESGAGGGIADRVSPRVTVQLLQQMAKRPDWPVFKAALPVLGVDGTLADVVASDSPARGKVFGKTGTYGDEFLNQQPTCTSSLGGVMTTASGRTLVYTIFVNDVTLPHGVTSVREGKQIGHLCEIIYQHAK